MDDLELPEDPAGTTRMGAAATSPDVLRLAGPRMVVAFPRASGEDLHIVVDEVLWESLTVAKAKTLVAEALTAEKPDYGRLPESLVYFLPINSDGGEHEQSESGMKPADSDGQVERPLESSDVCSTHTRGWETSSDDASSVWHFEMEEQHINRDGCQEQGAREEDKNAPHNLLRTDDQATKENDQNVSTTSKDHRKISQAARSSSGSESDTNRVLTPEEEACKLLSEFVSDDPMEEHKQWFDPKQFYGLSPDRYFWGSGVAPMSFEISNRRRLDMDDASMGGQHYRVLAQPRRRPSFPGVLIDEDRNDSGGQHGCDVIEDVPSARSWLKPEGTPLIKGATLDLHSRDLHIASLQPTSVLEHGTTHNNPGDDEEAFLSGAENASCAATLNIHSEDHLNLISVGGCSSSALQLAQGREGTSLITKGDTVLPSSSSTLDLGSTGERAFHELRDELEGNKRALPGPLQRGIGPTRTQQDFFAEENYFQDEAAGLTFQERGMAQHQRRRMENNGLRGREDHEDCVVEVRSCPASPTGVAVFPRSRKDHKRKIAGSAALVESNSTTQIAQLDISGGSLLSQSHGIGTTFGKTKSYASLEDFKNVTAAVTVTDSFRHQSPPPYEDSTRTAGTTSTAPDIKLTKQRLVRFLERGQKRVRVNLMIIVANVSGQLDHVALVAQHQSAVATPSRDDEFLSGVATAGSRSQLHQHLAANEQYGTTSHSQGHTKNVGHASLASKTPSRRASPEREAQRLLWFCLREEATKDSLADCRSVVYHMGPELFDSSLDLFHELVGRFEEELLGSPRVAQLFHNTEEDEAANNISTDPPSILQADVNNRDGDEGLHSSVVPPSAIDVRKAFTYRPLRYTHVVNIFIALFDACPVKMSYARYQQKYCDFFSKFQYYFGNLEEHQGDEAGGAAIAIGGGAGNDHVGQHHERGANQVHVQLRGAEAPQQREHGEVEGARRRVGRPIVAENVDLEDADAGDHARAGRFGQHAVVREQQIIQPAVGNNGVLPPIPLNMIPGRVGADRGANAAPRQQHVVNQNANVLTNIANENFANARAYVVRLLSLGSACGGGAVVPSPVIRGSRSTAGGGGGGAAIIHQNIIMPSWSTPFSHQLVPKRLFDFIFNNHAKCTSVTHASTNLLYLAVAQRDSALVDLLLHHPLFTQDLFDQPNQWCCGHVLHFAASIGEVGIAQQLLASRFMTRARFLGDKQASTRGNILRCALSSKNLAMVRLILDHPLTDSEVFCQRHIPYYRNLLFYAASLGDAEIFRTMVESEFTTLALLQQENRSMHGTLVEYVAKARENSDLGGPQAAELVEKRKRQLQHRDNILVDAKNFPA
ncbi:unnamed protein product [Amoebophrya sp. A120]|nr:unnamed protein product [Amoebophrya sp. A120]|eukprot:GSA120T00001443001.1